MSTLSTHPDIATLRALAAQAKAFAERSHAPYTGRAEAVILLLGDGTWVPGVRVENASFPLTITAAMNAATTAIAAGRHDVVAALAYPTLPPYEHAYLRSLFPRMRPVADLPTALTQEVTVLAEPGANLILGTLLDPFVLAPPPPLAPAAIAAAHSLAARALVPESDFPVGCLLELETGETGSGRWIPGVNVEHPDWSRILCAERTALSTAVTYQATPIRQVFVSCPNDPQGSPCGACRQVLFELAADAVVQMDRGDAMPEKTTVRALLPISFTGQSLTQ